MEHQHRRGQAGDLSDEAVLCRPGADRHRRPQDEGRKRKKMVKRALPLSGLGIDPEEDDIARLRIREDVQ